MSERTHGMAEAYREAEESNVESAGVCPRCGREMDRRHHRWVGGDYDEEYPVVRCPCGNHYEPDFGWRHGTFRHHKVVIRPDGDGGFTAKCYVDDRDTTPYVRHNIERVEVFGGASDPEERVAFKRAGVVFPEAETLRVYA